MPKGNGLGMGLDVDGIDLSGDTNMLGKIGGGLAGTMEMQGIDMSAYERQGLLRDGALEWVSYFNPAAGRAHPKLSALSLADQVATVRFPPQVIGGAGAGHVCKQIGYDWNRANDGGLLLNVNTMCNGFGIEFGQQLTAGKRTDTTSPTFGAGLDYGATIGTTNFGLQMYYQLYSLTGANVTLKIQCSQDDASTDSYTDITGATSGLLSAAPTGNRVATATNAQIERWIRLVAVGTFTQAIFWVMAVRNLAAPAF